MTEEWTTEENSPDGLYVLHREFADGPDVFIVVNNVGSGFELRISWVTSKSEEPDIVKGPFKTLAEAKKAAHDESKTWDAKYAPSGH